VSGSSERVTTRRCTSPSRTLRPSGVSILTRRLGRVRHQNAAYSALAISGQSYQNGPETRSDSLRPVWRRQNTLRFGFALEQDSGED